MEHNSQAWLGFLRLSVGLTLLFTAFQEVQNAGPALLERLELQHLGFYALALFYGCMFLGAQAAPWVIHRMGQWALTLGAAGNGLFTSAVVLCCHFYREGVGPAAAYITLLLVALAGGLIAGLLWPAQGYLLTHYASPESLNWYVSSFSLCFFASGFLGPALVAPLHGGWVPVALLTLVLLGLATLLCLPPPRAEATAAAASAGAGLSAAGLLRDAGARRLALLGLAEGWCLNAFVSDVLPKVAGAWTTSDASRWQEHLQLVLLMNGLGHVIASLAYAPVANRFGRRAVLLLQSLVLAVATLSCDVDLAGMGAQEPTALLGAFLAGLGIILARNGNSALAASRYRHCAGAIFALLASVRFAGSIAGFLLMPAASGSLEFLVPASLGALAGASLLAAAHTPLFRELEGEGETGPAVVLLTNYVCFVAETLPKLQGTASRIQVISSKPEVEELCREARVHFRPFPACETLAFARLLREDAELQSAVAEVWRDLRLWGPDVLVTAGFPVLPKEVVTIPKIALNFHPADLPRYRGGLPLQAMILLGEKEFRCCVHLLTEGIDDGTVLARSRPLPVEGPAAALFQEVAGLLPNLVMEAMAKASGGTGDAGKREPVTEDVPHAFGVKTETVLVDGVAQKSNFGVLSRVRIEWQEDTATDLERAGRAFCDNRGLFTDYEGELWRVTSVVLLPAEPDGSELPGTVLELKGGAVVVQGLDGRLELAGYFPQGEKEISVGSVFKSVTKVSDFLGGAFRNVDRLPGSRRFA